MNTPSMKPYFITSVCIALLSALPIELYANTLSQFELDATKNLPAPEPTHSSSKSEAKVEEVCTTEYDEDESGQWTFVERCEEEETLGEALGSMVFSIIGVGLWYGGVSSLVRVVPIESDDSEEDTDYMPPLRRFGEPLTPYVRFEHHWHDVSGGGAGTDWRLEGGWGPLGLQRHTFDYRQDSMRLQITQTHGLYRMAFSQYVTFDIGLGKATLEGNKAHDGFSITTPLQVQFGQYVGAQLRPSWQYFGANNPTRIVDLSVRAGSRFVSGQAGLRWLKALDTELNGAFLGFSLHI